MILHYVVKLLTVFVFNDVEINRGEKIKGELIIEDATLNDFTTVKDLLGGVVQIYGSKIISLDLEERRKMKAILVVQPFGQKYFEKGFTHI